MERVRELFKGYPSQEKVVMVLLKHGVRVKDGVAYCGNMEITDAAIARAAEADRRVVRSTIRRIDSTPELKSLFSKLKCTLLMDEVAPEIGCTALEIVPTDASMPGILAGITDVMYKEGLSVRQAVVDDPGTRADAHLIVVVDGPVPEKVLPMIRQCRGVASLIIR